MCGVCCLVSSSWAHVCIWNSSGTCAMWSLDYLQSSRTLGWLTHFMTKPCQEPTYDERLTWEGRSDKMVQVWENKRTLNQLISCLHNIVKIISSISTATLILSAFRAIRCVPFSTITISWIMPFSYTGVQKIFGQRKLFLLNLHLPDQESRRSVHWSLTMQKSERRVHS